MAMLKTIGTWMLGIVMLGMAVWAFRLWMGERIASTDPTINGYTKALAWNPYSDEYHAILGEGYRDQMEGYDLDASLREFERAIELRPGVWTYYAALAGAREMKGDFAGAEESFRKAQELNPHNATLHWRVGNYFMRRNKLDRAILQLRAAVELEPGRLSLAADRLYAMGASVEEIGEKLVPPNRPELLAFLNFILKRLDSEPERAEALSWQTWNRWMEAPAVRPFRVNGLFGYIRWLIRHSQFDEAREVWRTGLREAELGEHDRSIVFNGGFETEVLGGGFDWVIPKHEEVYYEFDRATRFKGGISLRIDFSGQSNLAFSGPWQTIILPAGNFELSYVIKSEEITSDQGIYMDLRSVEDLQVLAQSKKVKGTREWSKIICKFQTNRPKVVELTIKRDKSEKFDNLLGGSVRIDEVKITHISEDMLTSR
jgi:tetratricopeptide (TPR) repeat protein